jgi:hypothetical protein
LDILAGTNHLWQDTIKLLNSDASLDLFRQRGAALLQISGRDKVQKAALVQAWERFHHLSG